MKTLSNGYEVPTRTYYYLLDWNDADGNNTMFRLFDKNSLNSLSELQYAVLFDIAQRHDYNLLTKPI